MKSQALQRSIDSIIIHCSATVEGKEYTVEDINSWHKKRGFAEIGYHYVVYLDGSVHIGRDINKIGAHCKGHNAHSVGICYIGGLDKNGKSKDTRTGGQKAELEILIKSLQDRYKISSKNIYGHRELDVKKDCPCFDVGCEYRNDKDKIL